MKKLIFFTLFSIILSIHCNAKILQEGSIGVLNHMLPVVYEYNDINPLFNSIANDDFSVMGKLVVSGHAFVFMSDCSVMILDNSSHGFFYKVEILDGDKVSKVGWVAKFMVK